MLGETFDFVLLAGYLGCICDSSRWRFTLPDIFYPLTAELLEADCCACRNIYIYIFLNIRRIAFSPEKKLHLPFTLPWCDP